LIDLPNPERLFAPGMSARVEVDLAGGRHQALTVARDAVVTKSDGRREVWRVRTEDGRSTADPVRVEIGRASGDRLEILSGRLLPGDRVVLLGNERLRPGDLVEPRPALPANGASTAAIGQP
jgi:multidrug efflux pump subunit AcrA (membrane-fusion protein)